MDNVKLHKEARDLIKQGIDKLAESVKCTLGPNGRNVIIVESNGLPHITKDGVSVAKAISFEDQYLNIGAELIKQVASKTCSDVGDGTTSATVLAWELLQIGLEEIEKNNINPVRLKEGIDIAANIVKDHIRSNTIQIASNIDRIKQVAYISTNNDSELSNLITDVLVKVGKDGAIRVEESSETYIKMVEGIQIESGYLSPHFVNDHKKAEVSYDNPLILVTNHDINNITDIKDLLEDVVQKSASLVIIANKIDEDVVRTLALNKLNGVINVVAVNAPSFGKERQELLKDIAIATGSAFYDKLSYNALPKDVFACGTAKKVIITAENTSFINGAGHKDGINNRIGQINSQLKNSVSPHEIMKLKERIARLSNGIATIYVGGKSEVEVLERKDRVDDALAATSAAIEEGIVPGGGCIYLSAIKELKTHLVENADKYDYDTIVGINVFQRALIGPAKQIVVNGGQDADIIDTIINAQNEKNNVNYGWNAKTEKFTDLVEDGVIDPAKVARTVIENAASVAGLVLLTECVILPIK